MTPPAGPPPRREGRSWLVLFTDLAMILLTFFVMMFSMSEPDDGKWRQVVSALSQRAGPITPEAPVGPSAAYTVDVAPTERNLAPGYLEGVIASLAEDSPALADMRINRRAGRLVLSLPGNLLFPTLSAELRATGRSALARLAEILQNIDNPIEVHGHTDPRPIRSGAFASNWDLSLSRALAVAQGLREAGLDRPVHPVGHADVQAGLVAQRGDRGARYALMRRVDIVILGETVQRRSAPG